MTKLYMCYVCNGNVSEGFWLDTGEPEKVFYCVSCATEHFVNYITLGG